MDIVNRKELNLFCILNVLFAIIIILSYNLIGYLIADIHIYKLLIYPICEGIYYRDRISDLYSYILYPIGQALWNRDRIYIVIDICPISEEI